jgi:DNA replication protein DnaC
LEWHEGWRIVGDPSTGHAKAELLPMPTCAFCGGVGRREIVLNGVTRAGKCRCQRVVDRVALFNIAGIPARHAKCSLESFDQSLPGAKPGWDTAKSWLDRFRPDQEGQGLVLSGEPGRGKTHLMVAVVRELIFRHGVEVRFVEFTHLLSRIREGMDRGDGDATTLTPLVKVPVLAIDELGKGRKTDWELTIIDEIVTRRYNSGGVLLATTNFLFRPYRPEELRQIQQARERGGASLAHGALEQLSDRLGDRVFSRLRETVRFGGVVGEDYRALRSVK